MGRGLGNVANAMPRAATKGIASTFETYRKVGGRDGTHQPRGSGVRASTCVLKQRVGMRRSGALTLGAVLMLGGVTGGRGDELSGVVGPASAGTNFPFALPTLPENWADLPVRLTASQSVAYNSNIFGVATGFALPPGSSHGDFISTTQVGLSTKPYWF